MVVSVATGTPAALVTADAEGVSHGGNTCEGCVISQWLLYIQKVFLLVKKKSLVMNVSGFSTEKEVIK